MSESSVSSLETSEPNNQSNSKTVNNGAASVAPNKQESQEPKPKTLAELFGDKKDESNLEISLDDDTPDDPNAPVDSLARLLKRLNITEEQAYKIKIPMADGQEALTIGDLKDKTRNLVDFELREMQFDQRRIKQEGEILRSQAELADLIKALPKDAIKPEVLEKIRTRRAEATRREKMLTLEHIEEWRDEKKRTADLEGMIEMFADYGFEDSFIETLIDHRAMKFARDSYLMRKRIKEALANVRDPKKIGGKPSGKAGKAARRPNNSESSRRTAAVTQQDRIRDWFNSKE